MSSWAIGTGMISALTLVFVFVRYKSFKVTQTDFLNIRPKYLKQEEAQTYNVAYDRTVASASESRASGAPKLKAMIDELIENYQIVEFISKEAYKKIHLEPKVLLTSTKKKEIQKKLTAMITFFAKLNPSDLDQDNLVQKGLLLMNILKNIHYLLLDESNKTWINEFYESAEDIEDEEFADVLQDQIEDLRDLIIRTKRLIDTARYDVKQDELE